jgi:Tfp pilus assembly PilM family ATPase
MPNKTHMGLPTLLTRSLSHQPIAIHFGSDMVRMMQVKGTKARSLLSAIEVPTSDKEAIGIAFTSFKGKRCVVSIGSENVLVQHIRVPLGIDDVDVRERLVKHDLRWGDSEIRKLCVTTTCGSVNSKQELLCIGIEREIVRQVFESIESAGGEVVSVTVPLYASLRAFNSLYRRDGDEKITSLLIDMDETSSMVMIAHGANCVFAHRLDTKMNYKRLEEKWKATPSLTPVSSIGMKSDRHKENEPRGLEGVQKCDDSIEQLLKNELASCLRHHDALFPDRAVDRVIFTGVGAGNAEECSAIASSLGIGGFIADPSAWIDGAEGYAAGPAWTTVAGICMRYSGKIA